MIKQIKWDKKYSVKVKSLDEQHKEFFNIANKILYLIEKPHDSELKERLMLLLVKLGKYAFYHLDYEEDCMKTYGCPNFEDHVYSHDMYRDKIKKYLERVRGTDSDIYDLGREVADFSQHWLSTHILNQDREYIDCLEGHDLD